MEKIRSIFFEIDFTWKKVIIFSLVTAVITAVLNLIPALYDTSFTDPAANVDVWILFALLIIMNCKSYKEAALKTFVFFLIGQPLIYLIEVPFISDGWSVFRYYPYWGMITLATVPGACMAYRVKVQDKLSAVILSIATGLLIILAIAYARASNVHVISIIFCTGLAALLIFALLTGKKERLIAFALTVIIGAAYFVSVINMPAPSHIVMLDQDHHWQIVSEENGGIEAEIKDGFRLIITPCKDGEYEINLADEDGNKEKVTVLVKDDAMDVEAYKSDEMEE